MILGGVLAAAMCAATGCSVATRLERQRAAAHLSQLTRAERQARQQDCRPQVVRLQRDSNTFFLAPVDTLPDGERVMSLQIEQVTVMAKVRSVPERNGGCTSTLWLRFRSSCWAAAAAWSSRPCCTSPTESFRWRIL